MDMEHIVTRAGAPSRKREAVAGGGGCLQAGQWRWEGVGTHGGGQDPIQMRGAGGWSHSPCCSLEGSGVRGGQGERKGAEMPARL